MGSRLELLPVELRLIVLEHIPNYRDLTALIMASRPYHAAYLGYRKTTVSRLAQAMLGDSFVDACVLRLWEGHLNRHPGDGGDKLGRYQRQWPPGPYRHVQVKFIHDWDRYATFEEGDLLKLMQGLLTARDFVKLLSYEAPRMMQLTSHYARQLAVRECRGGYQGGWWPRTWPLEVMAMLDPARFGSVGGGTTTKSSQPGEAFNNVETGRITKMLYRRRVYEALYYGTAGPYMPAGGGALDACGQPPTWLDFWSRLGPAEFQEWQQGFWKLKAVRHVPVVPFDEDVVAPWLPCWVDWDKIRQQVYRVG